MYFTAINVQLLIMILCFIIIYIISYKNINYGKKQQLVQMVM